MKKKYFINSFYFQKQLFERHLSEFFDFTYSPGFVNTRLRAMYYVPINIVKLSLLYLSGRVKKYDVIHFNRPEAFFLFKRCPNQISVFEVHGYDIGVIGKKYLKDIGDGPKYCLGLWLDKMIEKRILKNIHLVDIFYCSTPDLIQPLLEWSGRMPVWLPNPIDFSLFREGGDGEKLRGNPACFLAARLHGDKKPDVAINIFNEIIKPYFPQATLHLLDTGGLAGHYKKKLFDKNTYIWYKYMDKRQLVSRLNGADLIFGDFSIGALSMLPLQVMGMRKPIVTLDLFEIIKVPLPELGKLSLRLLTDIKFRKEYVENNYTYALSIHDSKLVALKHYHNLKLLTYDKQHIV